MPYQITPALIIDGTFYTLVIFSVITWTAILFKIWQFGKNAYDNRRFDKLFWESADLEAAKNLPESAFQGPEARVARTGFAWLQESQAAAGQKLKFRGKPVELFDHALLEQLQREQRGMDSGLTMLASIGSTAPFVGLFGTVIGIMNAMHHITESGSTSLDVVAGPIGDALVATAIGIAVAVPAVLAYNFFLRKVKHQRANLENFAISFSHLVFNEETQENP